MARDDKGTTVIEYGLIVSLVSVVIIIVLQAVGDHLSAAFTAVTTALGMS
jgi:Flp pilus assembly pilin Flp